MCHNDYENNYYNNKYENKYYQKKNKNNNNTNKCYGIVNYNQITDNQISKNSMYTKADIPNNKLETINKNNIITIFYRNIEKSIRTKLSPTNQYFQTIIDKDIIG